MNVRQLIVSAVLTLLILGAGALVHQKFKAQKKSTVSEEPIKEELRLVTTKFFEPQTIKSKIEIDGRLKALEKIDLFAEATGRLQTIGKQHKEGATFQKGDLLFEIESQDERYNLYAQRSNLLNAITQIMPDLKFDYPDAFQKWKSYLDAFDVERSVKKLPEVSSQQEKYFVAGKNIYNIYYNIKGLEDRMQNFQIYAPFNGVFLTVNAYPGSLVSPGFSLGKLMNTSQYELVAPINMKDFKYVKVGQKVHIESEELGKKWTGYVNRISNQIDQATQSIPLYISISGQGLRDGLFLKGNLSGNSLRKVIALPKSAVIDQDKVFLLNDSILVQKQLEVLSRTNDQIIVRGLSTTDHVVTEGVNRLYAGQKAKSQK